MKNITDDMLLDLIIKKSIEDNLKESYNDNFLRIEYPSDYTYNTETESKMLLTNTSNQILEVF